MRLKIIIATALALCHLSAVSAGQPRLTINIIVGSMRASDLERYADNFTDGGFRRLMQGGALYRNAAYDYMLTTTPVSLATIVTGAQPSVHGIVGEGWYDYTDNSLVGLIDDDKEQSLRFSTGSGNYSPRRLIAPTLADALLASNDSSKAVSIAVDPVAAIVMAGKSGEAYWAEGVQTHWTTSSYYVRTLPQWIEQYNLHDTNQFYELSRWTTLYDYDKYINSEVSVIEGVSNTSDKRVKLVEGTDLKLASSRMGRMRYTPAGNTMILEFATSMITIGKLGTDADPDILNIYLDPARYIAEAYGPESVEYEDMLYRLDKDLEEFLTFVTAQFESPSQLLVTLTSDHGTSPSYNPSGKRAAERFNHRQMEVIVNAFLGARYGSDNYITGYRNNAIYLDHNLLYRKNIELDTIQEQIAAFVLQFRGVSHALSARAMRNTSFGEGTGRSMQRSFYPARSGDVVITLMPGWIDERDDCRSLSGSAYNYDRRVPMIIFGGGIKAARIDSPTDITDLTATEAYMLGIDAPAAASGRILDEARD
ncbi:MAG: alkaline phosphatase family protein [Alistipes sp.]|nr:alkaline phosphatase family protein [Alistipes sp.]